MLLKKFYNEEEKHEECFYKSSNICYSKCLDNEDALKTLKVIFNNGAVYLYKGVDVKDYLKFRESESQGKALYSYISNKVDGKPKYEYVRMSDVSISEVNERLSELNKSENDEITANEKQLINLLVDKDGEFIATINESTEEFKSINKSKIETLIYFLDLYKISYVKNFS